MQFWLKQEGGPKLLFSVLDISGQTVYEVDGMCAPLGSRFVLRSTDGAAVASVTGVGLPDACRYTVSCGARRVRFRVKLKAGRHTVQFQGVPWHFRGSLLTRAFDVTEDGFAQPVMTHGHCWSGPRGCYAVTVARETDVPVALCIAAAVDSASVGACGSPVPAG